MKCACACTTKCACTRTFHLSPCYLSSFFFPLSARGPTRRRNSTGLAELWVDGRLNKGLVDNKCCCRSQSVVVVDIAQCDMIIWCACTQYLVIVVCCRFYATLICIKKRGVVDNRCCYYTRVAVAVVVTQRSSSSKLAIIFAFEQIRSLSFYCHRIQLIAVCHGRGTCREYGVHAHVW